MKAKLKIRLAYFCLFCVMSFFIASCTTGEGGENPAPAEKTYTVNYQSDVYGIIPDALKNGISVTENTTLTEAQLPILTDDNAVFKGWYDDQTKAIANEYKVTKNVTLIALWGDEATVSYSSVFGTVPTSFNVKINETLTEEKLADIECSPYTFLGWFYSKDENGNGSGIQAQPEDIIKTDITLTAKWDCAIISFETKFGSSSSISKYTGQKITEAEIPFLTEEGYTFEGWFDEYTKFVPGDEGYEVIEDKTFSAKWTPNQYKVTFNAGATDAIGIMEDQTFTFAKNDSLSLNSFTRTGYTFQGWAATYDAVAAVYADGQNFSIPAQNVTLYAVWKANEYTITFNANNGMGETSSQKVTFGTISKLNANAFTCHGYRFTSWNTQENGSGSSYSDSADFAVTQAADISLYAQWVESDRYVISYQNTRGVLNTNPTSFRASEGMVLSDLSMTGYLFEGWYDSQDSNGNGSGTKVTGWGADVKTGDIILYAKWSPKTDTVYKVEHYQENVNDDGYTLVSGDTENKTGTTDAQTSANAKDYVNFTPQSFEQAAINPDGSTVVKIYYKRNAVTMTFNLSGGIIGEESIVTKTGKFGSSFTIGTPFKTGWTFASWSPDLPDVMEEGSYTASYTANTDTAYKVLHYQQNADDDGYTLKDTDNMTGTTEQETAAAAKSYEHFMAEAVTQKTIAADGTTELRINYQRETVTLILDLAGGTLGEESGQIEKSGKWGQTVIAGVPERQGYVFAGWNTEGGELPATYASNETYTALWTAVKGITISVGAADLSVIKSISGSTVTFSAEECDFYSWVLDGTEISTSQTCAIDTKDLIKGTYTLSLEAQKGGRWYSYYAQIKVGE